ncbi:MAG: iron-siderophore ABC transporter substrate-binding protein [Anaerolineales bacterium]|nr:iron-siderophore ABC transporter substrate-binding protein [Anaerolineales bacterium]
MFKRSFVVSLLFILALLAAACGAPAPAATPAPVTEAAVEEAATEAPTAEAAFPVSIEHKYGSTTIEAAPERIVLVGLNEQDALLALGVVPVATREWYGERPGAIFEWAQDELAALGGATPVVLSSGQLNFEEIAALEPDVIVGLYAGITQEEYTTLSQIAPTVAQPAEYVDWGVPWQEVTRTMGQIVGKAAEAENLIAGVESAFAEARAQFPNIQGAEAVVATPWGYPTSYYVYGSQDSRGRFMTSLGFSYPPVIDELAGEEFGASISLERFDIIDIDFLIWIDSLPEEMRNNPLYANLDIVKDGRVVYLSNTSPIYVALNFSTVLSIPFAIEQLSPDFAQLNQTLQTP